MSRSELIEYRDQLRADRVTLSATSSDIPGLRPLADCLASIFREPAPPVDSELSKLWEYLAKLPHPDRAAFVLKRNNADQSKVHWIQLLVLIAQAHAARAYRLLPRNIWKRKVKEALEYARSKWLDHVRTRGALPVTDEIIAAVDWLVRVMPRGIAIDGKFFLHDGTRIPKPMTPLQVRFMGLLVNANGKSVSGPQFRDAGVNHPRKIRDRLLEAFPFLRDQIVSNFDGGYRLED